MKNKFVIKIITLCDVIFSSDIVMATLPGEEGEFSILKDHAKMVINLKPGIINIQNDGVNSSKKFFVLGGIVQITEDDVNVISNFAIEVANFQKAEMAEKLDLVKTSIAKEKDQYKLMLLEQDLVRYQNLLNFL